MTDRKALKQEKKNQKQLKFLQKQTKHIINAPKDRKTHKPATPIPDIPYGTMKDLSYMPQSFDPLYVEAGWYNWWLENNLFKPNNNTEKFVICLPPPNVTGKLHIGHAMMAAVQDTIVRFHRMTGKSVLYLPGTDHAGIATQAVVEKRLYQNGINKNSLSRQQFIDEIFKWKNEHGNMIVNQLKRLGLSCDFSRQVFTLDNGYSSAVIEAFNILYERNYIYRKEKMVNWCGKMKTTLSDLEVDTKEVDANQIIEVDEGKYEFGVMYHFLYPIVRVKPEISEVFFVEVCTTRPETIIGDTALCFNPKDVRYDLKGCYAYNIITKQKIDIVFDDYCDPEFGNGIVKITPFHDNNDFEVAQRNGLKGITIMDEDNCVIIDNVITSNLEGLEKTCNNEEPSVFCHSKGIKGSFVLLDNKNVTQNIFTEDTSFLQSLHQVKRFDARMMVVNYLKENNLFVDKKAYNHTIPFCSRSNDIIEPRIKKQWWMDCKQLAEKAKAVVKNKEIRITPPESEKIYFNWLDNIRDWCLSRQLVWGHRIPAYRVSKDDKKAGWVVGRNIDDAINNAIKFFGRKTEAQTKEENQNNLTRKTTRNDNSAVEFVYDNSTYKLTQDEDVLDTWFSSGLWPFATLGWPNKTQDYESFFPTTLLETGSDILFFWVTRMVMLSLELTGMIPFKNILLHGIVRDAHGKKMSKSLGNIIDPVSIIEGRTLKELNDGITNVNEAEQKRAIAAQTKDFPNGIPCCGTDALRFTLCAYNNGTKDINLDVLRVEGYRRMGNKLWNAFKFVKMLTESGYSDNTLEDGLNKNLHLMWIKDRLAETIEETKKGFESYNLMNVSQTIYSFFLYDFCDVFIEIIKKRKDKSDIDTAVLIFIDIIKILHPIMPYLTEELYQRLKLIDQDIYIFKKSVSIDDFPEIMPTKSINEQFGNLDINTQTDSFVDILDVVKGIRSIVDSHNIKQFTVEINNKTAAYYTRLMIRCDIVEVENVKGQYLDSVKGIRYGIHDNSENLDDRKSNSEDE